MAEGDSWWDYLGSAIGSAVGEALKEVYEWTWANLPGNAETLGEELEDAGLTDNPTPEPGQDTWEEPEWEADTYIGSTIGRIGQVIGWLTMGEAFLEEDRERIRHWSVRGENVYPTDPDRVQGLFGRRADLEQYGRVIADKTGRYEDTGDAYYEAMTQAPSWASIRAGYMRGYLSDTQVIELLQEQGYHDIHKYLLNEQGEPMWDDSQTPSHFEGRDRGDRQLMEDLFWQLPGVGEVIRMETRDAFPREPGELPDDLRRTGDYQEWAEKYGTEIQAYEWSPGRDDGDDPWPILEALKQGDTSPGPQRGDDPEYGQWEKYGPPSFASYVLGAREEYSQTYEKMAQAMGIDPYLAMKHWEAHWQIPGWRMIRRVLWRSPWMTPEKFKAFLRWQDYPPKLLDPMVDASYRPLTRVDTRRMHLRGVFSFGRVFVSFLDHGYSPENAALMAQFTVTWNMERRYGDVIDATIDGYRDRALTKEQAMDRLTSFIFSEIPDSFPQAVRQRTNERQREAVMQAWHEARQMQREWLEERLDIAEAEREVETRRQYIETAKEQFTGWAWRARETQIYLTERGISSDRAHTLIERWQPERDREERLPSRSMLEEFLQRNILSASDFREYMSRKGYGEQVIGAILSAQEKLPTRSMLEEMFVDGIISEDMLREYLSKLGYQTGIIDRIVEAAKEQAEASKRRASVIALREAFAKGEATEDDLRSELEALNYSDKSIQIILRLARRDRQEYQEQQRRERQQEQESEE